MGVSFNVQLLFIVSLFFDLSLLKKSNLLLFFFLKILFFQMNWCKYFIKPYACSFPGGLTLITCFSFCTWSNTPTSVCQTIRASMAVAQSSVRQQSDGDTVACPLISGVTTTVTYSFCESTKTRSPVLPTKDLTPQSCCGLAQNICNQRKVKMIRNPLQETKTMSERYCLTPIHQPHFLKPWWAYSLPLWSTASTLSNSSTSSSDTQSHFWQPPLH